jgi:hypothetical protein
MTKQQALFYCQEKAKYEGYITHTMPLELYNDDDNVPQDMIDLICYPPDKEYHPYTILMGKGLREQIDMVTCHYILAEQSKDIPQS